MAYGPKRRYVRSGVNDAYRGVNYKRKAGFKGKASYGKYGAKPMGSRRMTSSRRSTGSKSIILKKTREFLWGTINSGGLSGTATYAAGTFTTPDNQGGTITNSLAGGGSPGTNPCLHSRTVATVRASRYPFGLC